MSRGTSWAGKVRPFAPSMTNSVSPAPLGDDRGDLVGGGLDGRHPERFSDRRMDEEAGTGGTIA